MSTLIPSLADFEAILDRPASPRLPMEAVAQKLAAGCDPNRLDDLDHVWAVLIGAGVRPEQVDEDLWPMIKRRAASIATERLQRERQAERAVIHLAAAFGVIVGVMLHSLPAMAAEPDWFETDVAPWLFLALIAVGFGFAVWPRRERETAR